MGNRVDARDVLDPNARTHRFFVARVVGFYRPTGPDPWDDYVFVSEEGDVLDVLPGLPIQLEPRGARFRMRRQGRVLRLEWEPTADDLAQLPQDGDKQRRALFIARYVESFLEAAGQAAVVIARKISE